jgi:hypothetical protein
VQVLTPDLKKLCQPQAFHIGFRSRDISGNAFFQRHLAAEKTFKETLPHQKR